MKHNTRQYRAGVQACMKFLSTLEERIPHDLEQSCEQYLAKIEEVKTAFIAVAGDMPPKAAGAFALLAETVFESVRNGYAITGTPDDFKCLELELLMTATERRAARQLFADVWNEAGSPDEPCTDRNVIRFPGRCAESVSDLRG